MLPRIEAGERLAGISDRALAAGNMHPADAARMKRRLEDNRRGGRQRVAKATPAVLRGMGIGIAEALSTASEKAQNDG